MLMETCVSASLQYCRMCLLSARAINAILENCVTGILQIVFTFWQGNMYSWTTASLEYCRMCLLSARAISAILENCINGILHGVFTFAGAIYTVMDNCVTGILQNVFTFCQANNMQSRRTTSLEYCRICLPSVRAIYYRHGELRQWNIAECVTEIVQNVFTFYKGNRGSGRITSWRPAPLEYCTMCLLSVRAICNHGELRHWNTA